MLYIFQQMMRGALVIEIITTIWNSDVRKLINCNILDLDK